MRIRIEAAGNAFVVELKETPTSKAIVEKLPFTSSAQTWGEEVYFSTPVSAKLEPDAQQVVEPGTVCFWTQGDAIALPYGRTPISTDSRPKLANPCNVLGTMKDSSRLKSVKSGDKITVSKA
jgi:uncharacterized protein